MKRKHVFIVGIVLFLAGTLFLSLHITPDMSGIGKPPHKLHEIGGMRIPFGGVNVVTIAVTWIIMGFLVGIAHLVGGSRYQATHGGRNASGSAGVHVAVVGCPSLARAAARIGQDKVVV